MVAVVAAGIVGQDVVLANFTFEAIVAGVVLVIIFCVLFAFVFAVQINSSQMLVQRWGGYAVLVYANLPVRYTCCV